MRWYNRCRSGGRSSAVEHRLPKPRAVGSNPIARSNPHPERVFAISPPPKPDQKADAHPLQQAVAALLLSKQVAGCTTRTLQTYRWWLDRFVGSVFEVIRLTTTSGEIGLLVAGSVKPTSFHALYGGGSPIRASLGT